MALKDKLIKVLRKTVDDLEVGNSELSESEAMGIMSALCHQVMSKAQACEYLNMSRGQVRELVRMKQLPRGKKRTGFKELVWYRDDLNRNVRKS